MDDRDREVVVGLAQASRLAGFASVAIGGALILLGVTLGIGAGAIVAVCGVCAAAFGGWQLRAAAAFRDSLDDDQLRAAFRELGRSSNMNLQIWMGAIVMVLALAVAGRLLP